MYKSPIELITSNIMTEIRKSQDNQIYQAVLNAGVNVDKDELIKALQYDRQQYEKGYKYGFEDGVKRLAELLNEKAKPHYFDNCNFAVPVDVINNLVSERLGDG